MFGADDAVPLGEADCEALGDGLLVQPVNAGSSVGYVIVGLWFAWWAFGLPKQQRPPALIYALLLILSGAGSVIYHGRQGSVAEFLHDAPVAVLIVMAIGLPLYRRVRSRPAVPGASRVTIGVLAVCAGVAGLAYVLGRTGSPLCDPESWAQLHGMWHLATAVGFGAWGVVLYPRTHDRA